jgi:transmembrane sensor
VTLDTSSPEPDAQAASWDARLRSHDSTPAERERFAAWLNEDSRNRESFDRLQAALSLLRKSADHPQLRGLRESARILERRSARYRLLGRVTMIAGLTAIVAGSVFWQMQRHALPSRMADLSLAQTMATFSSNGNDGWSTDAGEWKHITLPDGSVVTMNSSSRLEAEFLANERRIRLLAGQAFFRVAKNPARPFVVTAGQGTVTALGTTFDVRLSTDDLRVILVEGRVVVKTLHESSGPSVVELAPSQQFEMAGSTAPTVRHVNAVAETAWAAGQVIFADASLPDAVAQMNQYSKEQIIAGPELSRFRVNGMFRAGNQDSFVGAVTSYYPIDARQDSTGRIVLGLRPQ